LVSFRMPFQVKNIPVWEIPLHYGFFSVSFGIKSIFFLLSILKIC